VCDGNPRHREILWIGATPQNVDEDSGIEQHRGHQPTRREEARR
jgi:hypothetical protein